MKTARLGLLGLFLLETSCTTTVKQQGCVLQAFELSDIRLGQDTQETVFKRFGRPSTTSVFVGNKGGERWYYTQRVVSETAIGGKKPIMHRSLVIVFDEKGVVRSTETILGERTVPVSTKTTKEAGYHTSFLKETFRNIGKFGQGNGIKQP